MRLDKELIRSELEKCAASGLSRCEAAALLGLSYFTVKTYARGLKFPMKRGRAEQDRAANKLRFAANRDARYFRQYGCGYLEFKNLSGKVLAQFLGQKSQAGCRGISWELNLWQWWTIWQESGHWYERGIRHDQYVMCRKEDIGPYAIDNIFIAPGRENSSISPRKKTTLPMGVQKSNKKYQAVRRYDGVPHYLGLYPTPDLAYAAYLNFLPPKEIIS